jgi:hypothetical protein
LLNFRAKLRPTRSRRYLLGPRMSLQPAAQAAFVLIPAASFMAVAGGSLAGGLHAISGHIHTFPTFSSESLPAASKKDARNKLQNGL